MMLPAPDEGEADGLAIGLPVPTPPVVKVAEADGTTSVGLGVLSEAGTVMFLVGRIMEEGCPPVLG